MLTRLLFQQRSFEVARLFGIPLKLDASWIPMALLHLWLVAEFWLSRSLASRGVAYALSLAVTALFFASIVVHELAHALVARLEGMQIYDIQLHIFGGWARLLGEPRTALTELRIAIAGPAASFMLGLVFWLGLFSVQTLGERDGLFSEAAASALLYLVAANVTLAMFNLLPGLPLDGGRVLRAWLWHRRGDIVAATRTAKRCGVGIAYMLISYGLFLFFSGLLRGTLWQDLLAATWLLVVGVFLMNAAEQDYRHRVQQHAVEASQANTNWQVAGTVGAVMQTAVVSVPPELNVNEFIDRVLAAHRQTSFPVARAGRLHGILSLAHLRAVPTSEWPQLAIRDVMLPVDETHFIAVRASLTHAWQKLQDNEFRWLAVLDADGCLVGSLSEEDLRAAG